MIIHLLKKNIIQHTNNIMTNRWIQQFVEEFKNCKLNDEPVRYDIDFIWKLFTSIELSLI